MSRVLSFRGPHSSGPGNRCRAAGGQPSSANSRAVCGCGGSGWPETAAAGGSAHRRSRLDPAIQRVLTGPFLGTQVPGVAARNLRPDLRVRASRSFDRAKGPDVGSVSTALLESSAPRDPVQVMRATRNPCRAAGTPRSRGRFRGGKRGQHGDPRARAMDRRRFVWVRV